MNKNTKAVSSYSVDDVQKAKDFYTKVLGLNASVEMDGYVLEVDLGNDNIAWVYGKPDHTPATFTVLNVLIKNINETVDKLTEQGVKFEQYDEPMKTDAKGIFHNTEGGEDFKMAWFKDPAGNILSLVEGY